MPFNSPGAGLHPVGSGGQAHPVGSGAPSNAWLHPVGGPGSGPPVNPLVVQALASTRDALQRDPNEAAAQALLPVPPAIADDLLLCEPWVRIELATTEALAGVRFNNNEVWHVPVGFGENMPTLVPAQARKLVAFSAPPPGVLPHAALRVVDAASERGDRMAEIVAQSDDFWSFWAAVLGLNLARAPHTAELVAVAYHLATSIVMQLKHRLKLRRPGQVSPFVQPVIDVPGHASLPSGHATIAFMFAEIAPVLLNLPADAPTTVQLRRLADRIAFNRVVAGVHYPMDGWAGRLLGQVVGQYFNALCGAATMNVAGSSALLAAVAGESDPARALALQPVGAAVDAAVDAGTDIGAPYLLGAETLAVPGGYPTVVALWTQARDELAGLGLRQP